MKKGGGIQSMYEGGRDIQRMYVERRGIQRMYKGGMGYSVNV